MRRTIYIAINIEGDRADLAPGDVERLLNAGTVQAALAEHARERGHSYTVSGASSAELTTTRQRIAEMEDDILTGDVFEPSEDRRDLVARNTIMVVTSAGDINEGGTGRAQPYMRMPFDSYYSRSCFGKRIARKV